MRRAFLVVAVTVISCGSPSERARERFVHRFVDSLRDDTGFFATYVPEERNRLRLRSEVRPLLGSKVTVKLQEAHGDGSYEYLISGRERLLLYLYERNGNVEAVNLAPLGPAHPRNKE
jgi:hypothetical protein